MYTPFWKITTVSNRNNWYPSVFHQIHQIALVANDLEIQKTFRTMSIPDWLTLYVSWMIYLCKHLRKAAFSFNILPLLSLYAFLQIFHARFDNQNSVSSFAKPFFFQLLKSKSNYFYIHTSWKLTCQDQLAIIPTKMLMSRIKHKNANCLLISLFSLIFGYTWYVLLLNLLI